MLPSTDQTLQVTNVLAQIRAEPLMNYCAWNEPNVPRGPLTVPKAPRYSGWFWQVAGVVLVGLAGFSFGVALSKAGSVDEGLLSLEEQAADCPASAPSAPGAAGQPSAKC